MPFAKPPFGTPLWYLNLVFKVFTLKKPLVCQETCPSPCSDSEYISEQQCLANHFFSEDFSPCPVKCIPIQMRGFRYVNKTSDLKDCNRVHKLY